MVRVVRVVQEDQGAAGLADLENLAESDVEDSGDSDLVRRKVPLQVKAPTSDVDRAARADRVQAGRVQADRAAAGRDTVASTWTRLSVWTAIECHCEVACWQFPNCVSVTCSMWTKSPRTHWRGRNWGPSSMNTAT